MISGFGHVRDYPGGKPSRVDRRRLHAAALDRLQLPIGEPHHLQQQPAVPKARYRRLDDFEILLRGAEDQVEIAEWIEVSEIATLPYQHLVILAQQHFGTAQCV